MKKDEKNYWPYFIILLVFFAISMGVWTIKAAINNPVELDNSYMLNYHKVDADINDILKKEREFDKKYKLSLLTNDIKLGKNILEIELKNKKDNTTVKNAELVILVTRPDTTKFDKKITANYKDGKYLAEVDLEKEGRWNIVIRSKINNLERFKTYKLSTLK